MGTITGLTAERMLEIEANSVQATSVTVEETVEDVVAGDSETGTIELGKAYRLDTVEADKPCRLRLYISAAHRTADADRPRDEDPTGDHGCIAEIFLTDSLLSTSLIPMPHGYIPTGNDTYYLITNDDATDGDITFTFVEHVLED